MLLLMLLGMLLLLQCLHLLTSRLHHLWLSNHLRLRLRVKSIRDAADADGARSRLRHAAAVTLRLLLGRREHRESGFAGTTVLLLLLGE